MDRSAFSKRYFTDHPISRKDIDLAFLGLIAGVNIDNPKKFRVVYVSNLYFQNSYFQIMDSNSWVTFNTRGIAL